MLVRISSDEFVDAFRRAERDHFTVGALRVLYDYLEQTGDDTGKEYVLDVIAVCSTYDEMTVEEVRDEYEWAIHLDDDADIDDAAKVLAQKTDVVGTTGHGTVVFVAF